MAMTTEDIMKLVNDLTNAYDNFIEMAKNYVIANITDTTIAEIKQDAREYITSELASQKLALEQAIENAKIALQNQTVQSIGDVESAGQTQAQALSNLITLAEQSLNDKIAVAETDLDNKVNVAKTEIDNMISGMISQVSSLVAESWIKFFKNKIYVQRWGDADPSGIWDFDGYRWAEVDRQGVFDRPRGRGAGFKAMINGVETDLVGGGNSEFDGTIHGDRIRNIEGTLYRESTSYFSYSKINGTGAFSRTPQGWSHNLSGNNNGGGDDWRSILFDASRVVPTGDDNSPIYQTAIYWKLEEI